MPACGDSPRDVHSARDNAWRSHIGWPPRSAARSTRLRTTRAAAGAAARGTSPFPVYDLEARLSVPAKMSIGVRQDTIVSYATPLCRARGVCIFDRVTLAPLRALPMPPWWPRPLARSSSFVARAQSPRLPRLSRAFADARAALIGAINAPVIGHQSPSPLPVE